ncbi:MAG: hypothetical protein ABIR96_00460 [Bdellovibrionota bacterium]
MKIAFCSKVIAFASLLAGCAQLHHVQLSDFSDRKGQASKPIDIKVSETGVNLQEIADTAKIFSRTQKGNEQIQQVQDMIALFQTGPRTGNPVYVENYWRALPEMIKTECPSGRLTNIMSVRETRKYPIVSGEIVRIKATCLTSTK